jgi:hypothetical protein
MAALPVSVRRNCRSGVSRLRAQAVVPDGTVPDSPDPAASAGGCWPAGCPCCPSGG